MFQLVPSSPTAQTLLPFSDPPETKPEVRLCDVEMMKMDAEGSLLHIGHFKNPRSSASGTPLSSPTPLSRAYTSKASQSERSPSKLCLQAASRLRTLERENCSNAHRPLLNAFSIGSQQGINGITTEKEEMMTEALERRHIKQMNRQWQALLSSQAYATYEMIEEAEASCCSATSPLSRHTYWGLIAARPKGVRMPPQTPKKKACGGCTPFFLGVQTPARPPPHAARRPHAYKWREDGRLGVRPRRTGVLAMHACPARLT
ncbi:hypothetical protein PCANC_21087 [Puccinia coronata f. sp. avenae]|uniref:Uncharacterized protein n=1 Tax=Puccinia coronata f. sp. avenae TaxID=200324 RepID=A0A2N5TXA1_9BASI|nr:hypothetical protein PCANC_21087 [Puccinia coronata f. sp. avenae]